MQIKNLLSYLLVGVLATGCVTKIVNTDGSVQNSVVDKVKLSDTYVNLAIEYQKHDAPQVALDRLNLAIDTNSSNARAYMVRGLVYDELNKPTLAENDFLKAISMNSTYSEAYVSYGSFLCSQKRYDEAMKNFAIALDNPLYFTPEVGYLSRAKCEYQMNDLTTANKDLLRSLSFKNIQQDSYVLLAQIQFQQNNFVVAKYYIDKYSGTQTPNSLWLHIQILQALLDSGVDANKVREYTGYRNILARVLLDDYSNSPEAQACLIRYGQKPFTSNYSSVNSNNSVTKVQSAAVTKITPKTAPTPLPYQPVSTTVNAIPNNATGEIGEAAIIDNPVSSNTNSSANVQSNNNGIQISSSGRRFIIMPANITLYSLAKQYGLTVTQVEKYNNVKNAARIKLGTPVYLDPVGTSKNAPVVTTQQATSPTLSSSSQASNSSNNDSDKLVETITGGISANDNQPAIAPVTNNVVVVSPTASTTTANSASAQSANAIDNVAVASDANGRRYIIVPAKTTAFSISRKFNISVKQLEQYNRMKSSQVVSGMKLYIDPAK